MLKFDQIPPTVEGTEIDPELVREFAYGVEGRCINGVAEVCAVLVVSNTVDLAVLKGIGEKAGRTIAGSSKSQYPEDDGGCFSYRYDEVAITLLADAKSRQAYRKLVDASRRQETSAELARH